MPDSSHMHLNTLRGLLPVGRGPNDIEIEKFSEIFVNRENMEYHRIWYNISQNILE